MPELQNILEQYGKQYKEKHNLPIYVKKTLNAIEKWIYNQKFNVLNVQYFHVVFTIPDTLNKVVYYNQTKMYNIMFKAVSETLQELANDKKYLGSQIGFTTILHTWGSKLKRPPTYTLYRSSWRT